MNSQPVQRKAPEDLTEYLHFYHTNQKNYLVVQFEPEEAFFETGMILNNTLDGLLPVSKRQQRDCYELLYDISNMQSLGAIHRNSPYHFSELADYLKCLKNLLVLLDDYLLNADDLVLREEYLFVSYDGNRFGFIYLPGYRVSFQRQMKDLNDQVMRRLDHLDERATRLIYELDRLFCMENWNFEELDRILLPLCNHFSAEERNHDSDSGSIPRSEEMKNDSGNSYNIQSSKMPGGLSCDPVLEGNRTDPGTGSNTQGVQKERTWWQKLTGSKKQGRPPESILLRESAESYGGKGDHHGLVPNPEQSQYERSKERREAEEESFLNEDSENTGILQEESFTVPCLLPLEKNRIRIPISKDQVVIGSLRDRADFFLEDSHVSRMHLRIFRENNRWYIMDQNSTNGTFLEEERLLPYEKYELANYSRVRIADREYTFRIDS